MPDSPVSTLVIGIGSYYGDDAAGLEVTDLLRQKFNHKTDIAFYTTNALQEIMVLIDQLESEHLKALVIIDVPETDSGVCDITQLELKELQCSVERTSDHYASLYEILKIIKILYLPDVKISIFALPLKQNPECLLQSAAHLQKLISTV